MVQCSKQIKVREDAEASQAELAEHFPDFLWVLRDFVLQLTDEDENQITPQQYLEKCLEPQKGTRKGTQEKNRIREGVKSVFRNRDCVTLVRPMLDEAKLQKLNNVPWAQVRTPTKPTK